MKEILVREECGLCNQTGIVHADAPDSMECLGSGLHTERETACGCINDPTTGKWYRKSWILASEAFWREFFTSLVLTDPQAHVMSQLNQGLNRDQSISMRLCKKETNRIIESLRDARVTDPNRNPDIINCAINWASLRCTEVAEVRLDGEEPLLQVTVEEADPGAVEFQEVVSDGLARAGFPGVRVVTEW